MFTFDCRSPRTVQLGDDTHPSTCKVNQMNVRRPPFLLLVLHARKTQSTRMTQKKSMQQANQNFKACTALAAVTRAAHVEIPRDVTGVETHLAQKRRRLPPPELHKPLQVCSVAGCVRLEPTPELPGCCQAPAPLACHTLCLMPLLLGPPHTCNATPSPIPAAGLLMAHAF